MPGGFTGLGISLKVHPPKWMRSEPPTFPDTQPANRVWDMKQKKRES